MNSGKPLDSLPKLPVRLSFNEARAMNSGKPLNLLVLREGELQAASMRPEQ